MAKKIDLNLKQFHVHVSDWNNFKYNLILQFYIVYIINPETFNPLKYHSLIYAASVLFHVILVINSDLFFKVRGLCEVPQEMQ